MTPRFLIVDGASSMRDAIRDILENEDYRNISEAENGEEACEIFTKESPDVIIMDLSVDGRSGMECLKEMKEKNDAAKVIICSASAHRELVMEAVKLGASDFILKPLKPQRLIQAVNKAIGSF